MNPKRLWERIQQGHVHNIDFSDFVQLIKAFGFEFDRQRGTSHQMYMRESVREAMNVQPNRDGSAKPYQVRQLKRLVQEYDLKLEDAADE